MLKIKVQRKNTKQDQSKHGHLNTLGVRSGAMKDLASSVDRSHPVSDLCRIRKNEAIRIKLGY